jgi:hypothetical protein
MCVTIKWGDILLSSVFTTMHSIMEYTHNEYCNMLLNLGTCNSQSGTDAWENMLHYPGQCHPVDMCFDDWNSVSLRLEI